MVGGGIIVEFHCNRGKRVWNRIVFDVSDRDCSFFRIFLSDHVMRCHPFVKKSYLNPRRKDVEGEAGTASDMDVAETSNLLDAIPGQSNDPGNNEPVAEDDKTDTKCR